jgi:uncharacterized protein (UPF0332 family)
MAFPEDLLQLAYDLVMDEEHLNQAYLRRAVSTGYYALFHLLIDEAVGKWAVERQRSSIARIFEHRAMKTTCNEILTNAKNGADVPEELRVVSHIFIQLQEHRHTADYNNSKQWSRRDVLNVLTLTTDAFNAWYEIREQDAAQDFLLQLFLPKLPKA